MYITEFLTIITLYSPVVLKWIAPTNYIRTVRTAVNGVPKTWRDRRDSF